MSVGRDFVASKVVGSNQLNALSRHGQHGLFHEGTCGQVTTSAGMTLAVGAIPVGAAIVNGTVLAAVTGSTVSIGAADATNPRRDIVYVDTAGAFGVTAGTAAAIPAPPTLTDARLALAEVAVAANASSISSGNITDTRQRLSCARLVKKTSATTKNTSASFSDVGEMLFSIFPNEVWSFDVYVYYSAGNASAGGSLQFTVPASCTGSWHFRITNAATVLSTGYAGSMSAGFVAVTSGAFSGAIAHLYGVAINSSTAGTVQLQMAQGTSHASNLTISGSSAAETWIVARRLL